VTPPVRTRRRWRRASRQAAQRADQPAQTAAPGRIVTLKVTGGPGTVVADRVEIADMPPATIGEPLLVARRRPRSRRCGRSRITVLAHGARTSWSITAPLDQRVARLLGRDGRPLPVPVNLTERDQNGQRMLAADRISHRSRPATT
jgi:hypothetical protein